MQMEITKIAKYNGYEQLSPRELLSIIIGKPSHPICDLPMKELMRITESEILSYSGIGPKKAQQILASIELAKKMNNIKLREENEVIKSPEDGFRLLNYLRYEQQENFVVIALNTKNEVLGMKTIFKGSLNASVVHPREVLEYAIKKGGCDCIIVAHNHPSQNSTPSDEDIAVTERLVEASKIVGIQLLDHLIIGEPSTSLRDKGHM